MTAIIVGVGDNVLHPDRVQRAHSVRNCEILQRFVPSTYKVTHLLTASSDILPCAQHIVDLIKMSQNTLGNPGPMFIYFSTSIRICGSEDVRIRCWDSKYEEPLETYLPLDLIVSLCQVPTVIVVDAVHESPASVVFPTSHMNKIYPSHVAVIIGKNQRSDIKESSLVLSMIEKAVSKNKGVVPNDFQNETYLVPTKSIHLDSADFFHVDSSSLTHNFNITLSLPLQENCPHQDVLISHMRPAKTHSLWCDTEVCNIVVQVIPEHVDDARLWIGEICANTGSLVKRRVGALWTLSVPANRRDAVFESVPEFVRGLRWTIGASLVSSMHHWVWMETQCRQRTYVKGCELMFEFVTLPSVSCDKEKISDVSLLARLEVLEARHGASITDREAATTSLLARVDQLHQQIRDILAFFSSKDNQGPDKGEWANLIRSVEARVTEQRQALDPSFSALKTRCDMQEKSISELENIIHDLKTERESLLNVYNRDIQNLQDTVMDKLELMQSDFYARKHEEETRLQYLEEHTEKELGTLGSDITKVLSNVVDRMNKIETIVAPAESAGSKMKEYAEFSHSLHETIQQLVGRHDELRRDVQEANQTAVSLQALAAGGPYTYLRQSVVDFAQKEVGLALESFDSQVRSQYAVIDQEVQLLKQRVERTLARIQNPDATQRITTQLAFVSHETATLKSHVEDMMATVARYSASFTPEDAKTKVDRVEEEINANIVGLAKGLEALAGGVMNIKSNHEDLKKQMALDSSMGDTMSNQLGENVHTAMAQVVQACNDRIAKAEEKMIHEIAEVVQIMEVKTEVHEKANITSIGLDIIKADVERKLNALQDQSAIVQQDLRRDMVDVQVNLHSQNESLQAAYMEYATKARSFGNDLETVMKDAKESVRLAKDVAVTMAVVKDITDIQNRNTATANELLNRLQSVEVKILASGATTN
eukprot:PhF_6_TR15045/c0_g1_i1/m.23611